MKVRIGSAIFDHTSFEHRPANPEPVQSCLSVNAAKRAMRGVRPARAFARMRDLGGSPINELKRLCFNDQPAGTPT